MKTHITITTAVVVWILAVYPLLLSVKGALFTAVALI